MRQADSAYGAFLGRFARAIAAGDAEAPKVTVLSIEQRYFSWLMRIRAVQGGRTRGYYAKFPKVEMERTSALPPVREPSDVALGAAEYQALVALGRTWPRSASQYALPAFFDSTLGAIVLPEILGEDLYRVLRTEGSDAKAELLRGLGGDLARYHAATGGVGLVDCARSCEGTVGKARAVDSLAGCSVSGQVASVLATLRPRLPNQALLAPAIKGFEVRNVIVAGGGRLWLVDPGKLKSEPAEADVARFLVSCGMLWWGRARFPVRPGSEGACLEFLTGYGTVGTLNRELLCVYLVRETLKSWMAGVRAAELKRAPRSVTWALVRWYVNPGFHSLLERHVRGSS